MYFEINTVPSLAALQTGVPRDDGLLIYAPEHIAERNKTYELAQYLPDHLMIGDDSGGRGVLVDLAGAVWICGMGAWYLECREALAPDLPQWIAQGCPLLE